MKRVIVATIVAAMAVAAGAVTLVGHRGCVIGVENTAEAFRNAHEVFGYDGIECDVRVTADGEYIICHDEHTGRLGDSLVVTETPWAVLRELPLSQTRLGVTYTGRLCTVAEYLDIRVETGMFPIIELKWTMGINNDDMSRFDGLAALVEERGLTDRAIILTSMRRSLEWVRTHHPRLRCQWLCRKVWVDHIDWCREWGIMPSIMWGDYDAETVARFAAIGQPVATWTVDNAVNALEAVRMGVQVITTNRLSPVVMGR